MKDKTQCMRRDQLDLFINNKSYIEGWDCGPLMFIYSNTNKWWRKGLMKCKYQRTASIHGDIESVLIEYNRNMNNDKVPCT